MSKTIDAWEMGMDHPRYAPGKTPSTMVFFGENMGCRGILERKKTCDVKRFYDISSGI